MLDFIKEKQDVWQILQLTDKPVVYMEWVTVPTRLLTCVTDCK